MALSYTSGTALETRMRSDGATFSAAASAILSGIATATNELIEGYIGAPIGSGGTAARTYDGDGRDRLWIRQGIQGITTLGIADETGGTFSTLSASEYVLRPASHDRPTGWPAFWVQLTDKATTYGVFTNGFDTVRITPTGWGWSAIPAELSMVADIMGTRLFQSRQGGEMLVVGSTDFGNAIVRFLPEPEFRAILDRYRQAVSPWVAG